jgi:cell division transport system ATP-binding protein
MIQFFHVYKSYQKNQIALNDISFKIEKGDFVCLTGPSGSGKTTLLKLIFGAERANEGQILVDGRNIARLGRRQVAHLRRSIGVVFQDFKLIPNRNVFDNVAVTLHILGFPASQIDRRVRMMLKLVGLEDRANSQPSRLSGGEQQRIAIARALVDDPKILLADEPTGNLDPSLTLEILDLLREINLRGTTILLATHDRRLVSHVSKRELMLMDGKLFGV